MQGGRGSLTHLQLSASGGQDSKPVAGLEGEDPTASWEWSRASPRTEKRIQNFSDHPDTGKLCVGSNNFFRNAWEGAAWFSVKNNIRTFQSINVSRPPQYIKILKNTQAYFYSSRLGNRKYEHTQEFLKI